MAHLVARVAPDPKLSTYSAYRQLLRRDFWYSCGYCTIGETEARAIGFEIDHYLPVKIRPDLEHDYNNLIYSCERCNNYKRVKMPTATQCQRGFRFFRPDCDEWLEHFDAAGLEVKGRTPTGQYSEHQLRLNGSHLIELRTQRQRFKDAGRTIDAGLRSLAGTRLDRLPKNVRGQLQRFIRRAQKQDRALIDEALCDLNRSRLLDPDPEGDKKRSKKRREFLAMLGSLEANVD